MRSISFFLACAAVLLSCYGIVTASVFLPYNANNAAVTRGVSVRHDVNSFSSKRWGSNDLRLVARARRRRGASSSAVAIPGYGLAEQVFIGGFANFLSIYNLLITGRILLSWFPQAQGIELLQPLYTITDPFLNVFRGLIPPLFGIDFSPIAGFFLLNVLQSSTAALGYDKIPEKYQKKSFKQQITQQQPVPLTMDY